MIVVVSFSEADQYPDEAGCVRADCILAGWVIRPVRGSSGELESQVRVTGSGDQGVGLGSSSRLVVRLG